MHDNATHAELSPYDDARFTPHYLDWQLLGN